MPALQETFNHLDALLSSLTGISLYVSFGDKNGAKSPMRAFRASVISPYQEDPLITRGSGCNQNGKKNLSSRRQRFYQQVEGAERRGKACHGQDQRGYGGEAYTVVGQHLFHAK